MSNLYTKQHMDIFEEQSICSYTSLWDMYICTFYSLLNEVIPGRFDDVARKNLIL